jgi:hypothetical protein
MRLFAASGNGSSSKSRAELKALKLKDIEAENVLPGRTRRFEVELAPGGAAALPEKLEVEFDSE